ncbi:MAG: hypothetical protein LBU50_05170 [Cellulomonas sp.]|jgi:hypothetical protein|nr:hypothetical protein [Cellulomonas sp.]
MRSILRSGAAGLLAGGVLVATAVSAAAEPTGDPCGRTSSYVPGTGCVLVVTDLEADCVDGADPYLAYTLTAPVPTEQVRITVSDGTRTSQVTGGPDGSVAWPAAVDGKSATVTFTTQTTPAYTASVAVSTPSCVSHGRVDDPSTPGSQTPAADPGTDTSGGEEAAVLAGGADTKTTSQALAITGSQVGPIAGIATGLLLFGGLVFLASRRRSA